MQKDKRHYTFLFTHSFKSKTYIRRIEISKKRLPEFVAALVFGLTLIAVFGFTEFDIAQLVKAEPKEKSPKISRQNNLVSQTTSPVAAKPINYERSNPATTANAADASIPFRLANTESEAEAAAMEIQLETIEKTSNPDSLPRMWAHLGKINTEFGFRRNPFGGGAIEFHPGLDIAGTRGDSVIAPATGTVVKAGWQGGYGNLIEIDHGNGLITRYGHLSKINVAVGDSIERGELIGLIGSTGRSTGPHLHFEIRLGDKAINPRRFLPPEMPS